MKVPSLRENAIAAALVLCAGFALVFFYAPLDADQGFIQKIFYLHVPLAIVLARRVRGRPGYSPSRHLRTGKSIWDVRSYVSIHLWVIFGVGVLVTGAIWAKARWGKWWVWDEPTLVSFLIVFLLYATYYPLRYAIEDRDRQARYASVFAITAGAFVPLNFVAVRHGAVARASARVRDAPTAACLARCCSPSSSAWLGMALLWISLVRSSSPRSRLARSSRACAGARGRGARGRRPARGSRRGRPSSATSGA